MTLSWMHVYITYRLQLSDSRRLCRRFFLYSQRLTIIFANSPYILLFCSSYSIKSVHTTMVKKVRGAYVKKWGREASSLLHTASTTGGRQWRQYPNASTLISALAAVNGHVWWIDSKCCAADKLMSPFWYGPCGTYQSCDL